MSRIRLVAREEFPADQIQVYDAVASRRGGRTGNVFRALANSPGALEHVAPMGAFLRFDGTLPAQLREMAIVSIALELKCRYVEVHHRRLAQAAGVSEADLDALTSGSGCFSPEVQDALAFTALVAANGRVPDDLLDRLRGQLGEDGIVELTVLVGYYGLLGRFVNTFDVPLED